MKKHICNGLVICMLLLCCMPTTVEAANTLFDVPTMGLPVDNLVYENSAHTIQITDWPHGTEANIISGGSMESAVAEVNSNVTPSGGKSILSIYTNGADISGGTISAIAGGGWSRMAFYYYDYMVEGDASGGLGGQSPRCAFVEDETVKAELEQRGYDGECEMISVQGWYAPNAYVTMYESDSLFGDGAYFDVYKYVEEDNSFMKLSQQGFYGSNYLGLFYVQGDGIYIATTKALTEEQMASRETEEDSEAETENTDEELPTEETQGADESEQDNLSEKITIGGRYIATIRAIVEEALDYLF